MPLYCEGNKFAMLAICLEYFKSNMKTEIVCEMSGQILELYFGKYKK